MHKEVLLLMGSPKKTGYSNLAASYLDKALLDNGVVVNRVDIMDMAIEPCKDCPYCSKVKHQCVINDDMRSVYAHMKTADALILVTPIYFNGVPSQVKALVDRTQMIFMSQFAHKVPYPVNVDETKKGAYFVAFGGAKTYENQFLGVEETMKWVLKSLKMPLRQYLKVPATDHLTKESFVAEKGSALDEIVRDIVKR